MENAHTASQGADSANNKNSGGNIMSLTKSATRRLSLMAGSSLVAASLSAIVSAGAALTPTAAAAQAICAPAPSGGAGTNSVTYGGSAYTTGIDCDSGGNMTVSVTTNSADIGGPGIVLLGTGADSVTFNAPNATASQEIDGVGLTGPLLRVTTGSGAIIVNAGALDADQTSATNMTHGILATSTSGDIDINVSGTIDAEASNANLSGRAAIEAVTGGAGSIDITVGSAQGRLYGILAETSGAGDLTIEAFAGTHSSGIAVIDATTGTGFFRFDGGGGNASIDASVIRGNLGGDALLNLQTTSGLAVNSWLVDLDMVQGATATINALGAFQSNSLLGLGRKAVRVTGGADVELNITSTLRGVFDFTDAGVTDISMDGTGQWHTQGLSSLSDGDDSLTIGAAARLIANSTSATAGGGGAIEVDEIDFSVLDFGDGGADRVINEGSLFLGLNSIAESNPARRRNYEIDLRLENLEIFENSGLIMLGAVTEGAQIVPDGVPDDVLFMSGTTFTGSGDSTITFNVNLNGAQSSCDSALRDPVSFDMPAADCVRIENGSTAGLTSLLVQEQTAGDRGSVGDIVLVDVSGGTSAAAHFVLDPNSSAYSSENGGVIDKGFFVFPLVYDADTQQHKLIATPGQNAQQFSLVAQAGHGLWRLSTGSWLDRQADLRGGLDEGVGGGVWMRIATEFADRDALQTVDVAGNPFTYDNTHEQSSYAVTGGFDLMTGDAGGTAYVLGLTAGYIHSDMEFEASPNAHRLDGWSGGGYASLISGGLFVDAALNANRLELESDVPALGLLPAGTILATNLTSVGAQVEAGWRLPFAGGVFVEPLAGVSYVRSKYDDLDIAADDPLRPGVIVEFDDPTSLRAGAGARVGLDQDYGAWRAQYSLLGRVWNEFGDETRLIAHNTGADAIIMDEFTGTFSEFGVGVNLFGLGDALSAFANFGGKFGDDYTSQNLSAGVRVNW